MKKCLLLSSLLYLSACTPEYVTPEQLAQLNHQLQASQARVQQLEQNQTQLRSRLEEVARSRLVPLGAESASAAESAYARGLQAHRAGQLEQAEAAFLEHLQQQREGEEALMAHYWLGDVYYTQRQHEMALRYWGAFLRQAPEHERAARALTKMVGSLRELGRQEEAQALQDFGVQALQ